MDRQEKEDLKAIEDYLDKECSRDLWYTSDCAKCGGEVLTDGVYDYRCSCAYPDDCPVQRLNDWRFYEKDDETEVSDPV